MPKTKLLCGSGYCLKIADNLNNIFKKCVKIFEFKWTALKNAIKKCVKKEQF